MNPTKTFTPLSEVVKASIGKCTAILPNHMQCWRAGDVQVHVVTQSTNPEEGNKTFDYQLCRAHAFAEQQEYSKAIEAKQAESTKPTK